jgi:dsDNA-specific endonuclease/ATPase MutS2
MAPSGSGDGGADDDDADEDPVVLELGDELDLHTFLPRDVPSLVPDYLDECVQRGLRQVRIIHGKGTGTLRRTVHAALDRHPDVVSYRPAEAWAGGWGATIVLLKEKESGGGS